MPAPIDVTTVSGSVKEISDILPFHDRFLQQLGDLFRYVLFRINFDNSPNPQYDIERNNTWDIEYGPEEILRLEKTVYLLLKTAFQDFAPIRHIFLRHQVGQSLCASRAWFSLLDKFKLQLDGRESYRK